MVKRAKAASAVSYISMGVMTALSFTQLVPALEMAGIAVWVGLASFFIVEAIAGPSLKQSGLRFTTMGSELKDKTVWQLVVVLSCVQILYVILGFLIFGQSYIDYDMGSVFIDTICHGTRLTTRRGNCSLRNERQFHLQSDLQPHFS